MSKEGVFRAWWRGFKAGFVDGLAHPFTFWLALSYYGLSGDRRPVDWIIARAG